VTASSCLTDTSDPSHSWDALQTLRISTFRTRLDASPDRSARECSRLSQCTMPALCLGGLEPEPRGDALGAHTKSAPPSHHAFHGGS
jgi:hypothetical protein